MRISASSLEDLPNNTCEQYNYVLSYFREREKVDNSINFDYILVFFFVDRIDILFLLKWQKYFFYLILFLPQKCSSLKRTQKVVGHYCDFGYFFFKIINHSFIKLTNLIANELNKDLALLLIGRVSIMVCQNWQIIARFYHFIVKRAYSY